MDEAEAVLSWIDQHETLVWTLTLISVITFVGTLIAIPILIARIPPDYFVRRPVRDWPARRPAVHLLIVLCKNALGVILLLAGVTMLVLPGQGLLTMLAGIMLLDFPGKRRWERWLIRRRPILAAANWIRARRNRPPLLLPRRRVKRSGDRLLGRRQRQQADADGPSHGD